MSENCGSRLLVERRGVIIVQVICELSGDHPDQMHSTETAEGPVLWAHTRVIKKRAGRGLDATRPPLIDDTKRRRQGVEVQDRAAQHVSPRVTKRSISRVRG